MLTCMLVRNVIGHVPTAPEYLMKKAKTSKTLQEALEALRGTDMLLDRLLDSGEPVTRKAYLLANYSGEEPYPLPAELEAHLPEPLRIWSPYQARPTLPTKERSTTPAFDMAKRVLELNKRLSATGPTVTVKAPSDSNEFVVTFPQGRRPPPKEQPR